MFGLNLFIRFVFVVFTYLDRYLEISYKSPQAAGAVRPGAHHRAPWAACSKRKVRGGVGGSKGRVFHEEKWSLIYGETS